MKRYKFYGKKDTTKEAIGTVNECCIEDATSYFAKVKGMELDNFIQIFTVDEY